MRIWDIAAGKPLHEFKEGNNIKEAVFNPT